MRAISIIYRRELGAYLRSPFAWVIAAVGLNVCNPIPDEVADQATRLAEYLPGLTPEPLAEPLAAAIAEAADRPGSLTAEESRQLVLREPGR